MKSREKKNVKKDDLIHKTSIRILWVIFREKDSFAVYFQEKTKSMAGD